MIKSIIDWSLKNYQWILGILLQIFIAYHLFYLSKKLNSQTKLERKNKIKEMAEKIISEKGYSKEVRLVNIKRYFKDYPFGKEKIFNGYTDIRADIKSTNYNGIEFFESMPMTVYEDSKQRLTFQSENNNKKFMVWPVGLVPYEWIEYIDADGDEYGYNPLFFCHFKGKTNWNFWKRFKFFGYPYKTLHYYKKSEVYREGDPNEMKYSYVEEKIYKK